MSREFGLTILVKTPRDIAAKCVYGPDEDGKPKFLACGSGWEFRLHPILFTGLAGLEAVLRGLSGKRDRYIIRAHPLDGVDLTKPQRRLMEDDPDTGGKAALAPTPRAFVAADVDGVSVPMGLGRPERFADGAAYVRDTILGGNFTGIEGIATPTAQTGFVGDDVWRGRLWFLLSQAVHDRILFEYFDGLAKAKNLKFDPAVCNSTQPIYTGRCYFSPDSGFSDPFVQHELVQRIPPRRGCGDIVQINADKLGEQYASARAAAAAQVSTARRTAGGGFAGYIAAIGLNGEFHEPLKRAIGAGVTAGVPLHEIQAAIAARLAETADQKRLRDYDPRWVAAAFNSFTKRTIAAEARADASLTRLQNLLKSERA